MYHRLVSIGNVRLRPVIFLILIASVVTPSRAWADWVVTPFAGVGFGGAVPDPPRLSYGVSAGWVGDGIWGFEVELSRQPNFFAAADVPDVLFGGSSAITTAMFNGVVTLPSAGWAQRLRPYVVGGVGLFRSHIGDDESFIRGRSSNVGYNAGGGAIVSVTDMVGVRADVRYFRDAQDFEGQSEFFHLGDAAIDFWRATVGATFRF